MKKRHLRVNLSKSVETAIISLTSKKSEVLEWRSKTMSIFLPKVTEQIHLSHLVSFSSTYFCHLETGLSYTRRWWERRAHFAPIAGTRHRAKTERRPQTEAGLWSWAPLSTSTASADVHPLQRATPSLRCRTCGQGIPHMLF